MSNAKEVVVIGGEGVGVTLGEPRAADLLDRAVCDALATGVRTRDILHAGARLVGTRGMGDGVIEALERAG